MNKKSILFGISIGIIIVLLFKLCSSPKITGEVDKDIYSGKTIIKLDAGKSILFGQGSKYGYILKHAWKIAKENPNVNLIDIQLIIKGDDGYGNKKESSKHHLIFDNSYGITKLREYNDIDKLSYSEKAVFLDLVGMKELQDYKGDLSKDVFK